MLCSSAPTREVVEYCRRARALRASFADQPARLYPALRSLADDTDRRAEQQTVAPTPAHAFAARVAESLERGTLRYSRRLALIDEAAHLGIGRFEANLIIATVLHQAGGYRAISTAPRRRWAWEAAAFIAIQGALALAGWMMLAA